MKPARQSSTRVIHLNQIKTTLFEESLRMHVPIIFILGFYRILILRDLGELLIYHILYKTLSSFARRLDLYSTCNSIVNLVPAQRFC